MVATINKRLCASALGLMLAFQGSVAPVALADTLPDPPTSGCRVIKDDGSWFIDNSVEGCNDYYPAGHPCGGPKRTYGSYFCALQDRIKGVDPVGVDMIINAHRGVWGLALNDSNAATNPNYDPKTATIGGPAENSLDGLIAADDAGFQTVEFDVFYVRQDTEDSVSDSGRVYVTHFTDYAGFTDYRKPQVTPLSGVTGAQGYLMATPSGDLASISDLKLRDRNGAVTASTLMPLRDFVASAVQRGMLVVLDIKFAKPLAQTRPTADSSGYASETIGFNGAYPKAEWVSLSACGNDGRNPTPLGPEAQTLKTIMRINAELGDTRGSRADYRGQVIIKFPQSSIPCPSLVKWMLGPPDFEKLLFAPGIDFKPAENYTGSPVDYATDYVQEWMRTGAKSVAFWDTSIPSNRHWQGKPFTPTGSTTSYRDLMDYLYKTTGRRSAIWNIDPSGPGGRHGNFGMAWEHNPNTDDDSRGDQNANLVFSGASHALVTTDRPDIYLRLRNIIKAAKTVEP